MIGSMTSIREDRQQDLLRCTHVSMLLLALRLYVLRNFIVLVVCAVRGELNMNLNGNGHRICLLRAIARHVARKPRDVRLFARRCTLEA